MSWVSCRALARSLYQTTPSDARFALVFLLCCAVWGYDGGRLFRMINGRGRQVSPVHGTHLAIMAG